MRGSRSYTCDYTCSSLAILNKSFQAREGILYNFSTQRFGNYVPSAATKTNYKRILKKININVREAEKKLLNLRFSCYLACEYNLS